MAKREAFRDYCYNTREEKVAYHRSIRRDIVLSVRKNGVLKTRAKFHIGHKTLKMHLDEYRRDAGEPNMVIKKTTRAKPKRKPKE